MARSRRDVADRLHSTAIRLLRRLREVDAASGVPPARLSALSVLVFRGPASIRELAAIEMVRPPTMSEIVRALEADGLVSRSQNPDDARAVIIRATARGERLLKAAGGRRLDVLEKLLEQTNPAELQTLETANSIIARLLEK